MYISNFKWFQLTVEKLLTWKVALRVTCATLSQRASLMPCLYFATVSNFVLFPTLFSDSVKIYRTGKKRRVQKTERNCDQTSFDPDAVQQACFFVLVARSRPKQTQPLRYQQITVDRSISFLGFSLATTSVFQVCVIFGDMRNGFCRFLATIQRRIWKIRSAVLHKFLWWKFCKIIGPNLTRHSRVR
jgi:hypothetical protein